MYPNGLGMVSLLYKVQKINNFKKIHKMSKIGLNAENGKLTIPDVISRLQAMKNGEDLPEFDKTKKNDSTYCVEWGIKKGEWIADGVIDRYIDELNGL